MLFQNRNNSTNKTLHSFALKCWGRLYRSRERKMLHSLPKPFPSFRSIWLKKSVVRFGNACPTSTMYFFGDDFEISDFEIVVTFFSLLPPAETLLNGLNISQSTSYFLTQSKTFSCTQMYVFSCCIATHFGLNVTTGKICKNHNVVTWSVLLDQLNMNLSNIFFLMK